MRGVEPTTNAYIVWALLESGESPERLKREIAAIKKEAKTSKDSYVLALAANIMFLAKDNDFANQIAKRLSDSVAKEGAIAGAVTSITRSGGDALMIETTSLAILAWLKNDKKWAAQVETSMRWLFERSKAGRFGSTQSTVLALKAINAYDAARAKPKQPGSLQLVINGKPFGKALAFDDKTKGALELPDFAAMLSPGKYRVAIKMEDGSKMPFSLAIDYHTKLPRSSNETPIQVKTALSKSRVKEGEVLDLNVNLQVGDKDAPTPIAIVGIPAGLEVRHEQLKEWMGSGRIASYEIIGQDLVLYWRALKANTTLQLALNLIATVPGTFTGPASRSYLYYTDEFKHWTSGVDVNISQAP